MSRQEINPGQRVRHKATLEIGVVCRRGWAHSKGVYVTWIDDTITMCHEDELEPIN